MLKEATSIIKLICDNFLIYSWKIFIIVMVIFVFLIIF